MHVIPTAWHLLLSLALNIPQGGLNSDTWKTVNQNGETKRWNKAVEQNSEAKRWSKTVQLFFFGGELQQDIEQ